MSDVNDTAVVDESADNGGDESQSQPDPIKNLKSEMDRKLGNLEQSNQKLLEAIQGLTTKKADPPVAAKKVSDVIYEDADAAAEIIEKRAEERVMKRIDEREQYNGTIAALYNDYPELSDGQSEMTKKTLSYLSQYPEAQRKNPTFIKLAARDAAAELGVMTKNKRGNGGGDDFSFGGGNSGGGKARDTKRTSAEDDMILRTAEVLGVDISDPKKKERVLSRKRNEREWLQYRPSTTKKK